MGATGKGPRRRIINLQSIHPQFLGEPRRGLWRRAKSLMTKFIATIAIASVPQQIETYRMRLGDIPDPVMDRVLVALYSQFCEDTWGAGWNSGTNATSMFAEWLNNQMLPEIRRLESYEQDDLSGLRAAWVEVLSIYHHPKDRSRSNARR